MERIYSLWTRIRFSLYPFTVNVLSAIYELLIKKTLFSPPIQLESYSSAMMRCVLFSGIPKIHSPDCVSLNKKKVPAIWPTVAASGEESIHILFPAESNASEKAPEPVFAWPPRMTMQERKKKKTIPNKTGHGLAPYWTLTLWTKNRQQNRKNWGKTNACVAKTVSAPSKRVSLFANWNLFPIIPNAERQWTFCSETGDQWSPLCQSNWFVDAILSARFCLK